MKKEKKISKNRELKVQKKVLYEFTNTSLPRQIRLFLAP